MYLPPVANGSSKFFLKSVQELGSQLSFEGNKARHYRETDPRPAKERGYEVRKGDMTVERKNPFEPLLQPLRRKFFYVECIDTNSMPESGTFIFREKELSVFLFLHT